jgi:hypothetical protein
LGARDDDNTKFKEREEREMRERGSHERPVPDQPGQGLPEKKPYKTPELIKLGKIKELTQWGPAIGTDGLGHTPAPL